MVSVSRSWRPTTHTWHLSSILADLMFFLRDLRDTYTRPGRHRCGHTWKRCGAPHTPGYNAAHRGSLYGVTWVLGVSTAGLVAEAVCSRSIVWAHQVGVGI